MHCPFCHFDDTKVIDSRLSTEGDSVRRRRECPQCMERFTTFEVAELALPRVIKRDGNREAFDKERLQKGMLKALEKREVSIEQIDEAVSRIMHQLRASGDRETSSRQIGEYVMKELLALDEVAYVRFASVYHSFQDLEAFRDEIQRLRKNNNSKS